MDSEEDGENGFWVEGFVAAAVVFGVGGVVGAVAGFEFGVFLGVERCDAWVVVAGPDDAWFLAHISMLTGVAPTPEGEGATPFFSY